MASRKPKRLARDGVDEYGRMPLHTAVTNSKHEEAVQLLKGGADPNAQDDNGWSPLHFAAQAGSTACVEELLKAGASTATKDKFGNTALFRAVFSYNGDGEVIRLLLQAGADPLEKNEHKVSPASLAHSIANSDVAQFFAGFGSARLS